MLKAGYRFEDKDDLLAREIIQENTGGKDPEIAIADDFSDEIEIRLDQVKLYYPIMEVYRKRRTDSHLINIIPELCFLLLSYLIYEGKLKHRGLTFEEIESFLGKAINRINPERVEKEDIKEITKELLDAVQNEGRNFIFQTYSFKTNSLREKYIKFLEIKQSEEGVLQYYITEQGVDFYLKTKEFPDETKITINLLLFQKQMDKGAFGYAYETVRRLNMEVQKKKDKKYTILENLMYGQNDYGEAYNDYHKSITSQFEEESELFNAAMQNVRNAFNEYIERINNNEATEKEIRTFTLIKIIEKEISRAQTLHTELLKEVVGFTKEYDKVLGVRRKAIFTERFNFQGEFERIATQNKKPEILKYFFESLIRPNIKKSFNPLRALEPQKILRNKQDEKELQEEENLSDRETVDDITCRRVRKNFIFYAARLLESVLKRGGQVKLQEFCTDLKELHTEDSVYNGDFISFLIEMNRDKGIGTHEREVDFSRAAIEQDDELKTIEEVFAKASMQLKISEGIGSLKVKSFPEEDIEVLPGLKITDMIFEKGGNE